jgi:hypothetical protein
MPDQSAGTMPSLVDANKSDRDKIFFGERAIIFMGFSFLKSVHFTSFVFASLRYMVVGSEKSLRDIHGEYWEFDANELVWCSELDQQMRPRPRY